MADDQGPRREPGFYWISVAFDFSQPDIRTVTIGEWDPVSCCWEVTGTDQAWGDRGVRVLSERLEEPNE